MIVITRRMNNILHSISKIMITLPNSKLLSAKEAAQMLGIKKPTLALWRLKKLNLPYVRIGGKIMYRENDIITFLEKNTVLPDD